MKFFVLAGTVDGRLLAEELKKRGHEVVVSTLTEYGAGIVQEQGLTARYGALDAEEFSTLLQAEQMTAVIDATHPYAVRIQALAKEVCDKTQTPYFRWVRAITKTEDHPLIYWAKDLHEAAAIAAELGERILLTTGSNSLPEWLKIECFKDKTLYVRVLPSSKILERCESLGLKPYQIIAAQGPFSQAWNEALCKQLEIDVVIAKESGKEGGTLEKIQACVNLGIPLILLERPSAGESLPFEQFADLVEEMLCKQK